MPISSSLTVSKFVRRLHVTAAQSLNRKGPVVAIRREDASIWERRAPLAPHHVERLTKKGVRILIQPSNRRAYPLQSYVRAGAEAREDISEAAVILGVKQVPVEQLLSEKTYCFFSHTIKAQEANMPLLDAILEKRIRLVDYERMVDERDQRVVAFGRFAGVAGMINILHGLGLRLLAMGHHTPFMHIGPAHNYRSSGMAKQAIRDTGYEIALGKMPRSIGPLTFVFTGSGNVSQGAQEVFNELPIEYVEPADLHEVAQHGSSNKIYGTVVTRADHLRRKSDAPSLASGAQIDLDEYNHHPERYYSTFATDIAPHASVIVNGVYWPPNAPRLLTITDAKRLQQPIRTQQVHNSSNGQSPGSPSLPHRLIAICDISADPAGSIEFMQDCSTIDNPFYLYNPETNTTSDQSFAGKGFLICSIDNMPTQLPLESTDMFGNLLYPYIDDIVRSDATRRVEDEPFSGVVESAIIASNGQLRPKFQYIQELRERNEASQFKRTSDAKEVLVLGAGHVSGPLVEYLCRDPKVLVTIVSSLENEVNSHRHHARRHNNLRTVVMDVAKNERRLADLIGASNAVVSLLPYSLHPYIARLCIEKGTNMVTASYLSAELRDLDQAARDKGIVVMNEVGLDPGIDHLLAKQMIDKATSLGGKVTSFVSYCCGLPTPEFADNPLGYKFGWNPAGAFAITLNGAQWREAGQVCCVQPGALMEAARKVDTFLKGFALEVFPNRDSLAYQNLYGLPDAHTVLRGTLRYQGFSSTILTLKQLGLMDRNAHPCLRPEDGSALTWRQLMAEIMGLPHDVSLSNLKGRLLDKLAKCDNKLRLIQELGLLDEEPVDKRGSTFDTLCHKLVRLYPFGRDENDLVIMRTVIDVEWPDKSAQRRAANLVVYGQSEKFSAMAQTVGYPAAIATKMILDGEIQSKGMLVPLEPEVYNPMLERLRGEGIYARDV